MRVLKKFPLFTQKFPPFHPEPAEARNPIGPQNDIALMQLARQQIRRMFPRRHALAPNRRRPTRPPYTHPKPPNHSC